MILFRQEKRKSFWFSSVIFLPTISHIVRRRGKEGRGEEKKDGKKQTTGRRAEGKRNKSKESKIELEYVNVKMKSISNCESKSILQKSELLLCFYLPRALIY